MKTIPFTSYDELGQPHAHALRKKLFQFAHIERDIPGQSTYFYSFQVPDDREIILFDRTLLITNSPGLVQTRTQPDTITHGDPILVMNCWFSITNPGVGAPGTTFYSNSTNVTGGWVAVPELLDAGDRRLSGYGERGAIVIIPRGTTGAVEVQNDGPQPADFRLWVLFAECDLSGVDPALMS